MEGKGWGRKDVPWLHGGGRGGRGLGEDLGATGIPVCRPPCSGGVGVVACCPLSVSPLCPRARGPARRRESQQLG